MLVTIRNPTKRFGAYHFGVRGYGRLEQIQLRHLRKTIIDRKPNCKGPDLEGETDELANCIVASARRPAST